MKRAGEVRYQFLTFGLVLMTAGAEIAAKPVAHEVIGRVSTARAKTIWNDWKKKTNGSEYGTLVIPGRPHLWLRIPSCHLSALVMHESDPEALHRYPASRIAESGAVIVYAHRDVHFRALAQIQIDDRLQVELADGSGAIYQVRSIEIMLPEQINAKVEASGNSDTLFLLTCYPFRYIGPAPRRFLVRAEKISG
jgi:sortase A